MATLAAYDDIADWYEDEFLARQRAFAGIDEFDDRLGIDQALYELLGHGDGICVDIGCGTGVYAQRVRSLGWTPLGVDLSAAMLRRAALRLPIARADATRLPIRAGSVAAVVAVMVHTDMPDYPAVVREAARVLQPGGVFVHIGVHPCFCGGFADRSDPAAIVIAPGYLDGGWTKQSWTDQGLRDKVGAEHLPLPALAHTFLDAGLTIERFAEGAAPTPVVLAIRGRTPTTGEIGPHHDH